ncbi:MAG: thiamine pyrophosphate-dependent enzyme [Thermodesulfobacteriota bacterium]
MNTRGRVLLGNEAIAWGLLESGATVLTSYPGTPASEILATVQKIKEDKGLNIHSEWAINEKVAFEIALTHSWLGGRSAVMMKQMGLNVALDPLMSAAYTGVKGGLVVISADDPGPYSSQTEQDSRFLAFFAKIPVLDPANPKEAKEMVKEAYQLSEKFRLPVMVRPTSWVCHARQGMELEEIKPLEREVRFQRDPLHWAAPPRLRFRLHGELNKKIKEIVFCNNNIIKLITPKETRLAILSSGVPSAHAYDVIKSLRLEDEIALYKVNMPFPLGSKIQEIVNRYSTTLVLEETYPVMEIQLLSRERVKGRLDDTIPSEGELTAEVLAQTIFKLLGKETRRTVPRPPEGSPPRLCPGCPHRAAFWAIREVLPQGIFPSDIGCYTLGINLGAVDTFLCMGTSIAQAEGLYLSFRRTGMEIPPICATIGDSTFFHAGIPPLIDAVHQGTCFTLMILDNEVTAMTGGQTTPASPSSGKKVKIEDVVKGCGVEFLRIVDSYDIPKAIDAIKEADNYSRLEGRGVAVIISRHPCPLYSPEFREKRKVLQITERCTGCKICVGKFECPALEKGEDAKPLVLPNLCQGCGNCVHVCPKGAIEFT